jgi:hypothetical protein
MQMDLKKVAKTLKRSSVNLLSIAVRLVESGIEDEEKKFWK